MARRLTRTEDSGSGATILVADDEAALRQAVVAILRASGYKVLQGQTATEALEIAQEHLGKLDVLLTDIMMPGLRGPEPTSAQFYLSARTISVCNSPRTA